jgi:hypothetical protein
VDACSTRDIERDVSLLAEHIMLFGLYLEAVLDGRDTST